MTIQYEIYKETVRHLTIEAKDGHVETFDSAVEYGTSVRVIKDGRLGFTFSTFAGVTDKDLIEQATCVADVSSSDAAARLPMQSGPCGGPASVANLNTINMEGKRRLAIELEACARAYDPRIKKVRRPAYLEYATNVHIYNSHGIDVKFSKGLSCLSLTPVAEEGEASEWASEEAFALDPRNFNVEEVVRGAAKRAISHLGGRKISSIRTPCILDKRVVVQMLGMLVPSFFADAVSKKRSPLVDRTGTQVYSNLITLVNDATLKDGFSSVPYDAEGVATSRTVLVREGSLLSFLSDTYYADKLGSKSTGSSVRPSVMQTPKIGIQNLFVQAGSMNMENMMSHMGKGLFITDIMGLHTANTVTGDFSIGAAGFWVEGGKKEYSVKGITIGGNLHDVFNRVVSVGSNLKFWESCGAPGLLIEDIAVAGT